MRARQIAVSLADLLICPYFRDLSSLTPDLLQMLGSGSVSAHFSPWFKRTLDLLLDTVDRVSHLLLGTDNLSAISAMHKSTSF
jgi:hypothetical protein